MIDREDCYKQEKLYFYKGKVWKIKSFCPVPSVTMIAVGTKEEKNFGLGGLLDEAFKPEEEKDES